MNINPHFYLSILLTIVFFAAGLLLAKKSLPNGVSKLLLGLFFLATLPAASMILYYAHLVKVPAWYIHFRAMPAAELSMSFLGLFLGFLSNRKTQYLFAVLAISLSSIPFAKPILRPLSIKETTEWKDGVCLQSTGATCGPSCVATMLKFHQIEASEYEITRNSYTCSTGTEIWYLLRYATQKGLRYQLHTASTFEELKYPSIIGTKLQTIGHFVCVLGKSGDNFIIGDPLQGRLELSKSAFESKYKLDGLMIEFSR